MRQRKRQFVGLGKALERARIEDGQTQDGLAKLLDVSQPHLSKILTEGIDPSEELAKKIKEHLGERWPIYAVEAEDWLEAIRDAARQSDAFKELVIAAWRVVNKL